jgi:hypothetical protein
VYPINIYTLLYAYSNQQFCQDTPKAKTKRELEEEGRKKAPQTTHAVVSVPLLIRITYSRTLDRPVPTAPGLTKLLVRVRPDKHAISAGSRRRAAAMVVSNYPSVFRITLLMDIVSFQVAVARPSKRSQSLRFSHLESARHIRPQIPPLSDESR